MAYPTSEGQIGARERLDACEATACALIALVAALGLRPVLAAAPLPGELAALAQVHALVRGDLAEPLSTLHGHVFRWLLAVPGTEVEQLIAGRFAVYGLGLAAYGFVYAIARGFATRGGALFAVLCYACFSERVAAAAAFRPASVATVLALAALYLILQPRARHRTLPFVLSGAVAALAVLVAVEAAWTLPAFAAALVAAWWRGRKHGGVVKRPVVFALSAFGTAVLVHFAHALALGIAPGIDAALLAEAARRLLGDGPAPAASLARLFQDNIGLWLAVAAGGVQAAFALARRPDAAGRARGLARLGLLLPLAGLAFSHRPDPSTDALLFAAAAPLAAVAGDWLQAEGRRLRRRPFAWLPQLAAGVVFLGFAAALLPQFSDRTGAARALLGLVHRTFPRPVPYIDGYGMVASFPSVGLGVGELRWPGYAAARRPAVRALIERRAPVFLLANVGSLDLSRPWLEAEGPGRRRLLQEDFAVLRDNYLRYRGPLYVAGKRVALAPRGEPALFEILVPGPYTVQSETPVRIDGQPVPEDGRVTLAAGAHTLIAPGGRGEAVLRYGWQAWPAPPPAAAPKAPPAPPVRPVLRPAGGAAPP